MKIDKQMCEIILKQLDPDLKYKVICWKLKGFDQLVGFLGHHFILTLTYYVLDEERQSTFFVKSASEDPIILEYFKTVRCFEKEFYMVGNVLKELQSQIGEKLTANCYLNELNSVGIFEDLSSLGYESTLKAFDWNHVTKTVEKMAVFHATSIILEERTGTTIAERFPLICFESLIQDVEKEQGATLRAASNHLKYLIFEKMDDIPRNDKQSMFEWSYKLLFDKIKPSNTFRNVICHGDPWFMNFMYKYTKTGSTQDVLLVDFQFSRVAPPALDLQLLLSLRFNYDDFSNKGPVLLKIYYESLLKTLNEAGLNALSLCPFGTLKESFSYYKDIGVAAKAYYSTIISIPPEYLKKINSSEKFIKLMSQGDLEICSEAFDNDPSFKSVCSESIKGLYKEFLNQKC